MPEEQSFLDALKASPFDDTTRLVYADWLDEQGRHAEAEYLRLVVALVWPWRDDDCMESRRLLQLSEVLPKEWREAVGSRFTTVLYGFEGTEKIFVIKLVREAVGVGLAQAMNFIELRPSRLVDGATFERAAEVRAIVGRELSAFVKIHPAEAAPLDPPFRTRNRVIVGVSLRVGIQTHPFQQTARTAFREFVATELKLTAAEAEVRCRPDHVVVAEDLDTATANLMAADIRGRLPRDFVIHQPFLCALSMPTRFVSRDAE